MLCTFSSLDFNYLGERKLFKRVAFLILLIRYNFVQFIYVYKFCFLFPELLNSLCTLTNYILILNWGCWTPAHFYKIWWMTFRTGTLIIYIPIIHSAQKNNNNINFQMFYMQCHRMRTVCTIPPPHERIMIDLLPINHHFWQAHFTFPALHYFLSKGKVTFYNILLVRSYLSFQLIFFCFHHHATVSGSVT